MPWSSEFRKRSEWSTRSSTPALVEATRVGGKVGEEGRALAALPHPHSAREEASALPPLGLLRSLAGGGVTPEVGRVLSMTDALKVNLPQMLLEHEQVVVALHRLVVTAQGESRLEIARFAEKLKVHLALEEQVLSPTALVLGEDVRRRLGR